MCLWAQQCQTVLGGASAGPAAAPQGCGPGRSSPPGTRNDASGKSWALSAAPSGSPACSLAWPGCSSDSNLTGRIVDGPVVGWAGTMRCNPRAGSTGAFPQARGADSQTSASKWKAEPFEGHLGGLVILSRIRDPFPVKEKSLSCLFFCIYIFHVYCIYIFHDVMPKEAILNDQLFSFCSETFKKSVLTPH